MHNKEWAPPTKSKGSTMDHISVHMQTWGYTAMSRIETENKDFQILEISAKTKSLKPPCKMPDDTFCDGPIYTKSMMRFFDQILIWHYWFIGVFVNCLAQGQEHWIKQTNISTSLLSVASRQRSHFWFVAPVEFSSSHIVFDRPTLQPSLAQRWLLMLALGQLWAEQGWIHFQNIQPPTLDIQTYKHIIHRK